MKIETIFANWIAYENLSLDNKSIEEFCHKKRMEDPVGRVFSNKGGWQSNDCCDENKEIKELTDLIIDKFRSLANQFEYLNADNFRIDNFWININRKSDKNVIHEHHGSVMSAVYYVKVPENSGQIIFYTPIKNYKLCVSENMIKKYNPYNCTTYTYFPKIGDLIIFPAWLEHEVLPTDTYEERISIAFNANFFIGNKRMKAIWN